VKAEQQINQAVGVFGGDLEAGDEFGISLAGIGDLDGDGVEDLAVGTCGDDEGGTNQGAVWTLFLNPDGTVKGSQKLSSDAGTFPREIDDGDEFGFAVAQIGDFNGDSVVDLAVTAIGDDDTDRNGAIWPAFLDSGAAALPHCGNGILQEPLEECDDGNTVNGDGCSDGCICADGPDADSDTFPDLCDDCPLDPDNDADEDGICGDVDPCPFDRFDDRDGDGLCADVDNCPDLANADQADLDSDGVGDVCQLCSNLLTPEQYLTKKVKVRFKFVNTDPGPEADDRLQIKGEFALPSGTSFGDIDPRQAPTKVVVFDADGEELINVTAGNGWLESKVGWSTNASATKWRYLDRSGSAPEGIQLIYLTDRSSKTPGSVRLKIVGKDGDYPIRYGSEPLSVTIQYGNPFDAECTVAEFDSAGCQFRALGQTLTCQKDDR
jgi:cysteine-rich repeat protein